MTITFTSDSDQAMIRIPGVPDLAVGLNGVYLLTQGPNNEHPIGLRVRWTGPNGLTIEQTTMGEYLEVSNLVVFIAID